MLKYQIAKVIKIATLLTLVYIIAGVTLGMVFGMLNSPAGAIISLGVGIKIGVGVSAIYLLIFLILYQFIYKRTKHFHTFLRITLYVAFASFSTALLIFFLFDSFFQYSHFLRYKSSISYSIDSVSPAIYPVFIVGFISYVILTTILEIKNRVDSFAKPLVYWFFTVLISWYASVLILILLTGWKYQSQCTGWGVIDKSIRAQEYCYTIGEPLYYNWTFIPAGIMIAFEIFFITWYFSKKRNTKQQ